LGHFAVFYEERSEMAQDNTLAQRVTQERLAKGQDYQPRTKHLDASGWAKYTNRLFFETSPYLLQHAHNPVNWYPWGDEAFAQAKALNRPVLLSIGYSTCHWCHVMEEESFEDEEIAAYLNDNYVCIKVDREERPDVDSVYMSAVQAMTGRGGWPMNTWLTHDRKPFFGGTYFPPRDGDRGTATGFLTLVRYLKNAFDKEPDKVTRSSLEIADEIQNRLGAKAKSGVLSPDILNDAAAYYKRRFDSQNGGERGAPKFPSTMPVRFLLRQYMRSRDADLLQMATMTLKKMASGGIYDQVGGGFHRYSTDAEWVVPHFEKMLYDNALLVVAYLEAYQVTHDEDLRRVVIETLEYVMREMTSTEGAFYSASDADSVDADGHNNEGYYFSWTPSEIRALFDHDEAEALMKYFAISDAGDFEGRTVLTVPEQCSDDETSRLLERAKPRMLAARNLRAKPLRDDKILTAWNGLMISAFAKASVVLGEPKYLTQASRAAEFVLQHMTVDGRLLRTYKDGKAQQLGFLDDYAFMMASLIDLFEATGEVRWVKCALAFDEILALEFEDKESGAFWMTSTQHEMLLTREKPAYDGAEPSGNSVAVLNLLRLAELTSVHAYRQRAQRALETFAHVLNTRPMVLSEMLLAMDFTATPPLEIAIVAPTGRRDRAQLFTRELAHRFVPNKVACVVEEGESLDSCAELVPWLKGKSAKDGQATVYICQQGLCQVPAHDVATFVAQITAASVWLVSLGTSWF
jgi:uncharacterized protein YyaL (SSP411 family)